MKKWICIFFSFGLLLSVLCFSSCSKASTDPVEESDGTVTVSINGVSVKGVSNLNYLENALWSCNTLLQDNSVIPILSSLKFTINNCSVPNEYNVDRDNFRLYALVQDRYYYGTSGKIKLTKTFANGSRTGIHGTYEAVVTDSLGNSFTFTNGVF
ncbi:MAG: hypothetical protein K1X49_05145 [Saprospiraceae bacterium]|jgi:hypothetical protein|nr:hypothetical protein [Saprospiraceae bacterium]